MHYGVALNGNREGITKLFHPAAYCGRMRRIILRLRPNRDGYDFSINTRSFEAVHNPNR